MLNWQSIQKGHQHRNRHIIQCSACRSAAALPQVVNQLASVPHSERYLTAGTVDDLAEMSALLGNHRTELATVTIVANATARLQLLQDCILVDLFQQGQSFPDQSLLKSGRQWRKEMRSTSPTTTGESRAACPFSSISNSESWILSVSPVCIPVYYPGQKKKKNHPGHASCDIEESAV